MTFSLEFLSLLNLDSAVLTLWEVVNDEVISLLPFVGSDIHFKSLNVLSSLYKELFSLVVFADFGIVASDFDLVRSNLISRLVLHKVDGTVPVTCCKGRFNGLVEDVGLDEVINSLVKLSLRDKPITPFLFKSNNMVSEGLLGKIDSFFEGMTHHERVKSSIEEAHLLEEITSFLVHI